MLTAAQGRDQVASSVVRLRVFCARLPLTCVNLASNGVGRSWEKDQSRGDDNHAKDQKDGSVNPFEGVNATTGSCSIRVDATMGAAAN